MYLVPKLLTAVVYILTIITRIMVGTGIIVGDGRLFKFNNSRDWNNSRGRKNAKTGEKDRKMLNYKPFPHKSSLSKYTYIYCI